jgi:hypothetical protein
VESTINCSSWVPLLYGIVETIYTYVEERCLELLGSVNRQAKDLGVLHIGTRLMVFVPGALNFS